LARVRWSLRHPLLCQPRLAFVEQLIQPLLYLFFLSRSALSHTDR
jgi:hypothetical protein